MQILDLLVNKIMQDPRYKNNQVMQNAFNLYRNGDIKGLESYTQNVVKENGKNVEDLLNQAKNYVGRM